MRIPEPTPDTDAALRDYLLASFEDQTSTYTHPEVARLALGALSRRTVQIHLFNLCSKRGWDGYFVFGRSWAREWTPHLEELVGSLFVMVDKELLVSPTGSVEECYERFVFKRKLLALRGVTTPDA